MRLNLKIVKALLEKGLNDAAYFYLESALSEADKTNVPKIYFVEDEYNRGYRVGRTDWPGDVFNIVPKAKFEAFREVYEGLNMPLIDNTYED